MMLAYSSKGWAGFRVVGLTASFHLCTYDTEQSSEKDTVNEVRFIQ